MFYLIPSFALRLVLGSPSEPGSSLRSGLRSSFSSGSRVSSGSSLRSSFSYGSRVSSRFSSRFCSSSRSVFSSSLGSSSRSSSISILGIVLVSRCSLNPSSTSR